MLAQDDAYSDAALSGVFVDNHDQPRFLCDAGGAVDRLRLALAFALTVRGVPIVYYGTEQGFGDCANNRADMRFEPASPLYAWIRQLNAVRAATPGLRTGAQRERWQDDTAYAFERGDSVLVVFNSAGTARTLALRTSIPPGSTLRDALGTTAGATVDGGGNVSVTIPARTVLVLVRSSV